MTTKDHNVYIGAVYFRKTAPPAADWERDYAVAQEDGNNMFRHWFLWGAIERSPGEFDWADYDRHLDLAAKHDIKTVIAEMVIDSPEWLFHKYPHARVETMSGTKRSSEMHVSCATGGHHAMCLDNPEIAEAAGNFLRQLALRYREHPGLLGYDIWNECSFYVPERLCYCPATQRRFREWLKNKYGDVRTLGEAWNRYSYTDWEEVYLPRSVGPYPDFMDAVRFFNDNAFAWMKWRVDILKSIDQTHPVIAHGNAKSFSDIAPACGDDWRAGELVDIFGYTYWYANQCHPLLAADMIRSASNGKEFWRAEAVGNSEWTNRKPGQSPHTWQDYMSEPEEIRLDAMISFAGGALGYINPRWRPLLSGPLFGAYGWYGMDGSRTRRSKMVADIGKWANLPELKPLWQAKPVRGEVAVLLVEEAQAYCYSYQGSTQIYSQDLQGVYQAFLDSNIQCDIIRLNQINDYKLIYIPYPVALSDKTVSTLIEWVEKGGCLISEACPGYFNEAAKASPTQPSRGLEQLFGCVDEDVSFAPDRWGNLALRFNNEAVKGSIYRQTYQVIQGTACGWFESGEIAAVENHFGAGSTLLVGSMPGYAYKISPDEATRRWFANLLSFAKINPLVKVQSQTSVIARVWKSAKNTYLWVINPTRQPVEATITVHPDTARYQQAASLRGSDASMLPGNVLRITVHEQDACIYELI